MNPLHFCNFFFLKYLLCIFPQPLLHMASMLYHQVVLSLSKCVPSLWLSKFAAPTKIWNVYHAFHLFNLPSNFLLLASLSFVICLCALKIHLINMAFILLFVIKYQWHKINQSHFHTTVLSLNKRQRSCLKEFAVHIDRSNRSCESVYHNIHFTERK